MSGLKKLTLVIEGVEIAIKPGSLKIRPEFWLESRDWGLPDLANEIEMSFTVIPDYYAHFSVEICDDKIKLRITVMESIFHMEPRLRVIEDSITDLDLKSFERVEECLKTYLPESEIKCALVSVRGGNFISSSLVVDALEKALSKVTKDLRRIEHSGSRAEYYGPEMLRVIKTDKSVIIPPFLTKLKEIELQVLKGKEISIEDLVYFRNVIDLLDKAKEINS